MIIIAGPEGPGKPIDWQPGNRCEAEGNRPVKLIRTRYTTGLSAPITFGEIGAAQPEMLGDIEIVSTTMAEAISFVMSFDDRETMACPATKKEKPALDILLGCSSYYTNMPAEPGLDEPTVLKGVQEIYGFKGHEIIAPSTN